MDQKIVFQDSSGIKMEKLKDQLDRRVQKISRMVNLGFKKNKKKRRSKSKKSINDLQEGIQQSVQTQSQFIIQSKRTPYHKMQIKSRKQVSTVNSQKQQNSIGINTQIENNNSRHRKLTINTVSQINVYQEKSQKIKSPVSLSISQEYQKQKQHFNLKSNQNQKLLHSKTQNSYQIKTSYHKNNKKFDKFEKDNQESEEQNFQIAIDEANLEFQDSLDQEKYQSSIEKNNNNSPHAKYFSINKKISQLSNNNSQKRLKLQKALSKQKLQKQNDSNKSLNSLNKKSKSKQPISPRNNRQSSNKNLVNTKNNNQRSSKKLGLNIQLKKQAVKNIKTQYEQELLISNQDQQEFNQFFFNESKIDQVKKTDFFPQFIIKNDRKFLMPKISTQRRRLTQQKIVFERLSPIKAQNKAQKRIKQQKIVVSSKVKEQMQNLVKSNNQKPKRSNNEGTVRINLLKRIQEKNIKTRI